MLAFENFSVETVDVWLPRQGFRLLEEHGDHLHAAGKAARLLDRVTELLSDGNLKVARIVDHSILVRATVRHQDCNYDGSRVSTQSLATVPADPVFRCNGMLLTCEDNGSHLKAMRSNKKQEWSILADFC